MSTDNALVLSEPINYSEATQAANSPPIERDGGSFTAKARAEIDSGDKGSVTVVRRSYWCTLGAL
jgi:hypothetical protein